jgi:uncharacterized membrane protein (DUF106 family)
MFPSPVHEVFFYSVLIAVITAVLYRFLVNQNEMRKLKEGIKHYQKKMKEAQKAGRTEDVQRFLGEMTKAQKKQFSLNMRPMVITIIPFFILLVWWLPANYSDLIVSLPIPLPYLSWEPPLLHFTGEYNWFWWYLISFLPANLISRKLLGVE